MGCIAYLYCISVLHIFIAYISVLHIFIAYLYCISVLHIFVAYLCCISVLHICIAYLCCKMQKSEKALRFSLKNNRKVALLMETLVVFLENAKNVENIFF